MKTPVKIMIGLLLTLTLVACTSRYPDYGHRRGYGYGSGNYNQAYQIGYREGYEHGYEDRRRGSDFEYRHDRQYQYGISRDRYVNDQFRRGYVRGYSEGYYGRRYY